MDIKIVDGFIFYNELDMLEMRLKEHNDVVDYFILVEANQTFTGKYKPLYFSDNMNRYKPYLHKIIHIVVDDMPMTNDPWVREIHQRNCISRGFAMLDDKDIIILSDLDEILNIHTLRGIKNMNLDGVYSLEQDMFYYNFECLDQNKWILPKVFGHRYYKENNPDLHILRNTSDPNKVIKSGGWHCSYFGDVSFIRNKIQNFSHQEFNSDTYLDDENIKKQINQCGDLFGRTDAHQFQRKYIFENTYLPINYRIMLQPAELTLYYGITGTTSNYNDVTDKYIGLFKIIDDILFIPNNIDNFIENDNNLVIVYKKDYIMVSKDTFKELNVIYGNVDITSKFIELYCSIGNIYIPENIKYCEIVGYDPMPNVVKSLTIRINRHRYVINEYNKNRMIINV